MSSCLFCKIIAGEIPAEKVYEDDHVIAFLDINPINPGHTLVVPKTHTENIFSASPAVMRQVAEVLPKISQAVVVGVGAEACNIGINNGPISGQVIFHLHIHIMPRRRNATSWQKNSRQVVVVKGAKISTIARWSI